MFLVFTVIEICLNMCRIGNEMKLKLPAGGALWLNTTMLNHNFKNDKTKHKQ
jgi:hypothetical protein